MAEYRSIKNICLFLLNIRIQKQTTEREREREPQTLVIREVTTKCYELRYFVA